VVKVAQNARDPRKLSTVVLEPTVSQIRAKMQPYDAVVSETNNCFACGKT